MKCFNLLLMLSFVLLSFTGFTQADIPPNDEVIINEVCSDARDTDLSIEFAGLTDNNYTATRETEEMEEYLRYWLALHDLFPADLDDELLICWYNDYLEYKYNHPPMLLSRWDFPDR